MWKHWVRLFAVIIGLSSSMALASRATPEFLIHQDYVSTRALGMGNAFTAVADDHSSLFYNPAALAWRKEGQLRLFLRGAMSDNYPGLISDIDNANAKETESDKTVAIVETIESRYGEHYNLRAPTVGGVWVGKGWGVALIPADVSVGIDINQQLGPQLNVNAYADSTLAIGHARRVNWLGDQLPMSVGVTGKAIHRIQYSQSILAVDLINDDTVFRTEDADEGLTFDVDLGATVRPRIPRSGFLSVLRYAKPTVALVGRNLIDYGFPVNFNIVNENSGEPSDLERRFDLGTKWDLPNMWVFDPRVAIDVRDMGHRNWTFTKGLHLGAELYWKLFNWWKGSWSVGLNQGYFTAGFGAKFAWFQLELATYGEEVGTEDVPNQSRRYIAELSLDF